MAATAWLGSRSGCRREGWPISELGPPEAPELPDTVGFDRPVVGTLAQRAVADAEHSGRFGDREPVLCLIPSALEGLAGAEAGSLLE